MMRRISIGRLLVIELVVDFVCFAVLAGAVAYGYQYLERAGYLRRPVRASCVALYAAARTSSDSLYILTTRGDCAK